MNKLRNGTSGSDQKIFSKKISKSIVDMFDKNKNNRNAI